MKRVIKIPALPPRPRDGHKGMFGRVLIVGGHENMIGAPVLAGTAALRMGAGLVQVAMPQTILPVAISITPELIGLGLNPNNLDELLAAADHADALVIGPGMGQSPDALVRLNRLIQLDKPMVLDADALNLLAAGKSWPDKFTGKAVLTPHPGEMRRLIDLLPADKQKSLGPLQPFPTEDPSRIAIASAMTELTRQTILLKGHRTVITDGMSYHINTTGNSALSKAGSGDVLSGIIGCLLGQKLSCFDAASLGAYLHGLSGELAGETLGLRCPIARDIIGFIPQAISHRSGTND